MTPYVSVLRTAARQQWVYRGELGMRAVQMALFMAIFMALWRTAYGISGRMELAGYTLPEVVWYLAMTETVVLSSSRVFAEISEAVRAGELAYVLARPLSYPLYQVSNSLGYSTPRFVLNLLVGGAVVGIGMGRVVGSIPGLAAFLLLAALSLVLDALVAVTIGLLAFWIEEVAPVAWIYQKLVFTLGGLFLPLDMFPGWLRRLASALPFQLITYVPARAFVRFELQFVLRAAAGQLTYIAATAALVALLWRRAQRRLVVHGG